MVRSRLGWLSYYHNDVGETDGFEARVKQFDFIGLQRHIKVLGIFARLYLRDGKAGYLNDPPRVMAYTQEVLAMYPEFAGFKAWFEEVALPAAKQQAWYKSLIHDYGGRAR